jgi:L-asparaginase
LLCCTTGGTIASAAAPGSASVEPVLTPTEVLRNITPPDGVELEVVELANLPSSAITPALAFEWAGRVQELVRDDAVCGAVVTVGTSALEECAYLFDLVVDQEKPIVFTGAMRMRSDPIYDGTQNLSGALHVAAESRARSLGTLVVMNDEIHAAPDVTKEHSHGIDAFASPANGPLGFLVPGPTRNRVLIERTPGDHVHVPTTKIEERVECFKTVLGSTGCGIDHARETGARGIVIETFADGSTTTAAGEAIERALTAHVPVVLASRAPRGHWSNVYTAVGEGHWLVARGARVADGLSAPKARVKLMLTLGLDDRAALDLYFPTPSP